MSFNVQLRELNPKQRLAFCAAIAERMIPNYQIFAEQVDPTMNSKVRAILDTVWERLTTPQSRIDFTKQAEKLIELQPDPTTDESLASYLGLDVTLAIDHCLQLAIKNDDEQAVSISRLSRASVARFLEISDPESRQSKLSEQPLMQYEHECQDEILEYVTEYPESRPEEMKKLWQLIKEQEVSSIGLER